MAEKVAWEYPATRQAWRSYRNAGVRWLGASVLFAVLVVVVGQLVIARSQRLLNEGAATTATVVAADATSVTFRYDADGESRSATLDIVSGTEYAVGEQVEVRYDRNDPNTARLLAEPNRLPGVGPALVVLAVLAVGFLPIGLGVLRRALLWQRALRREPWQLARLRARVPVVELIPVDGPPARARLQATTRWRSKTVQDLNGREVWMLPVGRRDFVLTADGTDTLYGARARADDPA